MIILIRSLLAIIIIGLVILVCQNIGEMLFSSYYEMEWGISAEIMHSPPFGENYINKLAIVIRWALFIGLILGILCAFVGDKYFSRHYKKHKSLND